MKNKWIGPHEELEVGDVGFLICFTQSTGAETWVLRDTPAITNQTYEPRLHGWCGSYNNNKSTDAYGMARVVKRARNGRVLVEPLTGQALVDALEELGYPDLAPAVA